MVILKELRTNKITIKTGSWYEIIYSQSIGQKRII